MNCVLRNWDEQKLGEMTFENICRLFSSNKNISFNEKPPFIRSYYVSDGENQFAVHWKKYENGVNISGWFAEQTWFVLDGKCDLQIEGRNERFLLEKGVYIELPSGNFQLELAGIDIFEYILVCKLPDGFPKQENNVDSFR